ncbi:hypothetical protein [Miltoncostaea marina]|uniref:hypothetical protein n=1 Tax=Miltoncostaea marina TaxID=2843215 RepID=UPI001C3CF5A0|nr:hypothetical protein [Miltoncostaea marina]
MSGVAHLPVMELSGHATLTFTATADLTVVEAVAAAVEQLPRQEWPALASLAEELGKTLVTTAATYALDITDPGYQLMVVLVTWMLLRLAAKMARPAA